MLCCLVTALLSGKLLVAARMAFGVAVKPSAAKLWMLGGLAGGAAFLAPFAAAHAGHFAERAALNHRSILEEILAQPLCTGSPRHDAAAAQNRKAS